jgi:hypothetical protein
LNGAKKSSIELQAVKECDATMPNQG